MREIHMHYTNCLGGMLLKDNLKALEKEIDEVKKEMSSPDLCRGTASTYSRISGYYRPVENWNDGKATEFNERQEYSIDSHSPAQPIHYGES